MTPTATDRIQIIKNSLAEFKKVVEPVLDVKMMYFDRPYSHTLRIAIDNFEAALGANWRDHNQSAASDELVSTFA